MASDYGVSWTMVFYGELNELQTEGSLSRSTEKTLLLFIEMLRINTASTNEARLSLFCVGDHR